MKKKDDTIKVVFRGVRGSYPVPGKNTLKYGGNTTCHEVRAGGHLFIVDAGTGIISLGCEMAQSHIATGEPIQANLLFSHVHHDHTYGMMYFKPVYFKSTKLEVFGPKTEKGGIQEVLNQILAAPYHPVSMDEAGLESEFLDLTGGEILIAGKPGTPIKKVKSDKKAGPDDVVIRVCFNSRHTKMGIMHYRFDYHGKSYVFATDVEGMEEGDDTLIEFSRGADLLAHDGQYTDYDYYESTPPKKGWGHSTCKMAIATAVKAGVKQLAIIHHEPERDDKALAAMEKKAKKDFPGLFFAREGMSIEL